MMEFLEDGRLGCSWSIVLKKSVSEFGYTGLNLCQALLLSL